jgi:hypothetical protein
LSRQHLFDERLGVVCGQDSRKLALNFVAALLARNRSRFSRLIVARRNSSLCLPCTETA